MGSIPLEITTTDPLLRWHIAKICRLMLQRIYPLRIAEVVTVVTTEASSVFGRLRQGHWSWGEAARRHLEERLQLET